MIVSGLTDQYFFDKLSFVFVVFLVSNLFDNFDDQNFSCVQLTSISDDIGYFYEVVVNKVSVNIDPRCTVPGPPGCVPPEAIRLALRFEAAL